MLWTSLFTSSPRRLTHVREDKVLASRILKDEIRVFFGIKEDQDLDSSLKQVQIFNEFAVLLTLDNFRYCFI